MDYFWIWVYGVLVSVVSDLIHEYLWIKRKKIRERELADFWVTDTEFHIGQNVDLNIKVGEETVEVDNCMFSSQQWTVEHDKIKLELTFTKTELLLE